MPNQPHRLTLNSFQSPYSYRTSGLLQIAVSAPLRIDSLGATKVLAAEHCRYGTRDFASTGPGGQGAETRKSQFLKTPFRRQRGSFFAWYPAARSHREVYGRVPRLLEPLEVGVTGSPAQIGVMTGVATPMNSTTLVLPLSASQTFPEPSTAMEKGASTPAPV